MSGNDHPFFLPEIPCYLNELLASEDFYGGIEPQIGRKHIRVIAIDGFPKMSSPGILRELDSLPIEYRWNTRAILIDSEEARAGSSTCTGRSGVPESAAGRIRS